MQQRDNTNFLDPKTLIAVVLVGAVWFGWQSYLNKKYPPVAKSTATEVREDENYQAGGQPALGVENQAAIKVGNKAGQAEQVSPVLSKESLLAIETALYKMDLSSKGMGFKNIQLLKFTDRNDKTVELEPTGELSMATSLDGVVLDFNVKKVADFHYEGVASLGDTVVKKSLVFDPSKYAIKSDIRIQAQAERDFVIKHEVPAIEEVYNSSILMPTLEKQDLYVSYGEGQSDRVIVSGSTESLSQDFKKVYMFAFGSHYFASAVVDKSEIYPDLKFTTDVAKKTISSVLTYTSPQKQKNLNISHLIYLGPKSVDALVGADAQLKAVIDFGMFAWIAHPLLATLKWFYGFVSNWGVAIILLTLLVRAVVLPFNVMSYKSMKAMQKVQPAIQDLRTKYKDDPTTLNKEMMELMKRHKVNPLGGCLPMLLQLPVFFALYQVFGQSIELYQAPFFGWIQDLSSKDPFFVLPILMAVTMFVQQKITPTTMDPAQAKIMLFVPVIFSVFMLGLPSALTLYIFVSTLFGIVQQMIFLRDKQESLSIKQAKA